MNNILELVYDFLFSPQAMQEVIAVVGVGIEDVACLINVQCGMVPDIDSRLIDEITLGIR